MPDSTDTISHSTGKGLPGVHGTEAGEAGEGEAPQRIIFLNSVFPCLSETFVYDQYETLRRAGLPMAITSNRRPVENQVHPHMRAIQGEVVYFLESRAGEILAAHGVALLRHPLRYLMGLFRLPFAQASLRASLACLTGAALLLRRFDHAPRPRLHVHFTYDAAGVALWAARLSGIKYSLTLHGSDLLYDHPPDLAAKLAQADALVSISRFNADFIREKFPFLESKKIAVIPLGIPPLEGKAPERCRRSGPLRILNVGRLSDHKAQHYLIDACAILAGRGRDFRCDIVGEGPKWTFLDERIRQHRLEGKVRLLGPKYHHEVLALYGETDLFVLCSITEGMPLVLMEAMRAGVPVVAPAISAIPELIADGGVLVPPSDPQALADAIERFVAGEVDVAALTAKARRRIEAEFNLETNALRFKAFLETLKA